MADISRREFFRKAGADAAAIGILAATASNLEANPLGYPIGSQTYPHRALIASGNFADLCKQLKDLGVERLELCSALGYNEFAKLADAKETKKIMADHGLKSESAHFSMKELRETQQKSIDWAKEIGIKQMITASLGGQVDRATNTTTMDAVKKAADEYNKIAEVSAKAGIQQGLHNEGFEVAMVDGKRVYDMLFDLLDPKLVKFQFQMSTIANGLVAAEYFTKYPGRFISMHLQDIDMNAPLPPPPPPDAAAGPGRGGRGGRPQKPVGQGTIDWVKTFTAAKTGGVKNYFVEQSMDLTKQSVAYLKTLKI